MKAEDGQALCETRLYSLLAVDRGSYRAIKSIVRTLVCGKRDGRYRRQRSCLLEPIGADHLTVGFTMSKYAPGGAAGLQKMTDRLYRGGVTVS